MLELGDYYKQVSAAKLASNEPEPPRSGMYREQTEGKNPLQGLMYLSDQQRQNDEKIQALNTLTNRAKSGLTGAMGEIVAQFGSEEPAVFNFKVSADKLDEHGRLLVDGVAHERFGAKRIESDEQMARLAKDVEVAKAYFPEAKLSEMESARGERVAIVTGADTREFNAVMNAEREKTKLEQQAELLSEEKKRVQQKMGLNTDTAISGGAEAKAGTVAFTPASIKSKENELA